MISERRKREKKIKKKRKKKQKKKEKKTNKKKQLYTYVLVATPQKYFETVTTLLPVYAISVYIDMSIRTMCFV